MKWPNIVYITLIVFQSLTSVAPESLPALVVSASGTRGAVMETTTAGTGLTKPTAQVIRCIIAK